MDSTLWHEAANSLDKEIRDQIWKVVNEPCGPTDLLASVKAGEQRCLENRWTLYRKPNGHRIYFRDVFSKITTWLEAIKEVGDIAMQYDTTAASLPWAAVRLLLMMAINDVHKFGAMFESVAVVTNIIIRYSIVEKQYFLTDTEGPMTSDTELLPNLKKVIIRLYTTILIHLCKANRYFQQNKAKRIALSAIQFVDTTVKELIQDISENDGIAIKWLSLVQLNQTQDISTGIEYVGQHMTSLGIASKKNAEKLSEVLSTIEPIPQMSQKVDNIYNFLETDQQRRILDWISIEPYNSHHQDIVSSRLEDSCMWLIQKTEYRKWSEAFQPSIFWLHGDPGSGKTVLVSRVIDTLRVMQVEDPQSPCLAFFYCKRDPANPKRSESEELLLSLLRQLARPTRQDFIHPAVVAKWQERQDGSSDYKLSHAETMNLLTDITCYGETTIIIDALDECRSEQRHILYETLTRIRDLSEGLVKVFVSSRRESDIVDYFSESLNLEIEPRDNLEDITRFVTVELDMRVKNRRLLHGKISSNLQAEIKDRLLRDANGMFRWASASLQTFCNSRTMHLEQDVRNALGCLPHELYDVYSIIVEDINNMADPSRAIAKNALRWLLSAKQPLSSEEFVIALNTGSETSVNREDVLDICCNLVKLDKAVDSFQFMHLSIREYLENRPEYQEAASNAAIANSCLAMCLRGTKPKRREEDFKPRNKLFYDYVQVYWPMHCELAQENRAEGELGKRFRAFLCGGSRATKAFLTWKNRWWDSWTAMNLNRNRLDEQEIYDKLQECTSVVYTACVFGFVEVIQDRKMAGKDDGAIRSGSSKDYITTAMAYGQQKVILQLQTTSCLSAFDARKARLLIAAAKREVQFVAEMLLQDSTLAITETVIESAAASNNVEMVKYLIEHCKINQITVADRMLLMATTNEKHGHEVMEFLIDQAPDTGLHLPEEALEQACMNSRCGFQIIEALQAKGNLIPITNELIRYAAANKSDNGRLLKLFLRDGQKVQVDEEMLMDAASSKTHEALVVLLSYTTVQAITSEVLETASSNEECANHLVPLLLERCDSALITDNVLCAAIYNRQCGLDVVKALLLAKKGILISSRVLETVASSGFTGGSVLKELLSLYPALNLNSKILRCAAGNESCGRALMEIMLEHNQNIEITDEVLCAAASNASYAAEILKMLFHHRPVLPISSDMVVAAAGNHESGYEILDFLSRHSTLLPVSAEAVEEAASNPHSGRNILNLWLKQGADLYISQLAVENAAGNPIIGAEVLQLLLKKNSTMNISRDAIEIGAGNVDSGDKVLRLLFEHRGSTPISRATFTFAAANPECGLNIIRFLLEQENLIPMLFGVIDELLRYVNISQDSLDLLLEKAQGFMPGPHTIENEALVMREGGKMLKSLLDKNPSVHITNLAIERVVKIADDPVKGLNLLLQYKPDLEITDRIFLAAIYNKNNTTSSLRLFMDHAKSRNYQLNITDEVLETAISRGNSEDTAIFHFLLQRKFSQDGTMLISERLVASAAKCPKVKIHLKYLADKALKWGIPLPITIKAYLAAAENSNIAMDTLRKMDLEHFEEFSFNEEVLLTTASNNSYGHRIFKLFSDMVPTWQERVTITPRLLGEASQSNLRFLFQIINSQYHGRLPSNFITEDVVKRKALGPTRDLMFMWDKIPAERKQLDFTKEALKQAILYCKPERVGLLFSWIRCLPQDQHFENLRRELLSEEVLLAAVENLQGAGLALLNQLNRMETAGNQVPGIIVTEDILLRAAASGNVSALIYLLHRGRGLKDNSYYLRIARLKLAVYNNDSTEILSLLEEGAPPDFEDHLGFTPLADASYWGYYSSSKALLEGSHDINLNTVSSTMDWEWKWGICRGRTPLCWAALSGGIELVELLLEYGADPRIRDSNDMSAEDLAEEAGNDMIAEVLRRWRG